VWNKERFKVDELFGRADIDLKQFINQYEAAGGGIQSNTVSLQARNPDASAGMITLDLSFSYGG
jgi:hypothetical protein